MASLDKAIQIASKIHLGQKDRFGAPYILHPIRVMMRVNSEVEKTVAILHDVIEDSKLSVEDLRREGFPAEIVDAVACLTKREKESYADYIARTKRNPLALRVKLADLEDNMDLKRVEHVSTEDLERLKRYHKARQTLLQTDQHEHTS